MSALAIVCALVMAGAPGHEGEEAFPEGGRDEAQPEGEHDEPIAIGAPIVAGERTTPVRAQWVEHGRWHWGAGAGRAAVGSTLTLGLDWSAGDGWDAALEGRLRHRLLVAEDGEVSGELAPELRRASLRWQVSGGPELGVGWDVVRWGRTLARPFDVVSPHDLREGPLGPEGGERAPVLAISARQALGEGALALLALPFFSPALGTHPEATPTQDVLHSSELALRFTQRLGALDLGLGWVWRFDRAPLLPGVDAALPAPERQHVLGAELAWGQGPLRVLAESALVIDQRLFLADLASERRPLVRWGLDLGLLPAVFFDLVVGLEGAHAPGASERTLYEGPDDLWLRTRLGLMLAFDGVLRLDAEARVGLMRDDWYATGALTWRASGAVSVALGATLLGGEEVDGGLGALYDRHDHAWLRLSWTL